ncbi:GlxA family transcriptional regulator [Pseudosulfitobacter koreensis]|uniref:Helix-turn-helix domain-containing protein n=1 Tax=Pseudosulfitobacter koreensis TaxID=2968472 RepID=A0ABT1Z4R6_9RHOB|nr:helix-turn-helix domain-containing protein [Pseudosulfitobacter koreense]MCR8828132.1 helix-turn-helix domain-containing protein [Pseudosulfitobacter koreense]
MKSENITDVVVLVLDTTNTLSFAAAVDPLRAANRHAGRQLFRWHLATPTDAPVTLTSGLVIPANPLARIGQCDWIITVSGFDPDRQSTPALLASLRRLAARADHVAGVDGGPWVLARTGLLDGHKATVHWEDFEAFAVRFPETQTVNARYQVSGKFRTAGGAAPTLDMMLALIAETCGAALARKVAGSFITDTTAAPSQPQIRQPQRSRHSHVTARAHALMETTLDAPLPIATIAKRLGLSPRTLQLQFKSTVGLTPQAHYMSLRMAEAERLVTQTHRPLHDIALSTGFSSQSGFARAYALAHGTSARMHRKSA